MTIYGSKGALRALSQKRDGRFSQFFLSVILWALWGLSMSFVKIDRLLLELFQYPHFPIRYNRKITNYNGISKPIISKSGCQNVLELYTGFHYDVISILMKLEENCQTFG